MAAQTRRSPILLALRIEATVLMSLAIGQAGLASGFLTGHPGLKPVHGLNAILITVLTVAVLVTAMSYQRRGGPRWPILAAVLLLVVEACQILLARLDVAGPHIFLGVLFVVLATLLTSYLFRPGFVPRTG